MNYEDKNQTIGEVVVELPGGAAIFKEFGIDFCCGGHRNLAEVVKEQNIDGAKLRKRLEEAYEERKDSYESQGNRFEAMSPAVLTTYIEDIHHAYTRRVLPQIAEYLTTVLRVHGKQHQELFEVYRLFGQLKADLEQHLLKEETMLFPELGELEGNQDEITKLTEMIIREHEAAGEVLVALRRITNNYSVPEDGCETYAITYRLFEEMETDLHQHIHLENNILLKLYAKR